MSEKLNSMVKQCLTPEKTEKQEMDDLDDLFKELNKRAFIGLSNASAQVKKDYEIEDE